jgi:MFS family permease
VALPVVQRALGATAVDVQWVLAAYTLLMAALILVGGSLGDLLGRRRVPCCSPWPPRGAASRRTPSS